MSNLVRIVAVLTVAGLVPLAGCDPMVPPEDECRPVFGEEIPETCLAEEDSSA